MESVYPKQLKIEHRLVSDRVCLVPVFLYSVVLSADAVGATLCDIYNGVGTGGDLIFKLSAATSTTVQLNFNPPVFCNKGLYVALGANLIGLSVFLYERPE